MRLSGIQRFNNSSLTSWVQPSEHNSLNFESTLTEIWILNNRYVWLKSQNYTNHLQTEFFLNKLVQIRVFYPLYMAGKESAIFLVTVF